MPYTILQAYLERDKETLMSLWKRNFGWVPEGRYEWIYENNPSGRPTVFLLHHDKSHSVVGAISLFPRLLYLEGKPVQAWICGDLAVDQTHRTLGPAMNLLKAAVSQCKKSESAVLMGFPNEKSEPVMRKAGFEVLDDLYEMTRVVSTHPYVRRHIKFPLLSRIMAAVMDVSLWLRPSTLFEPRSAGCKMEVSDTISMQTDELWNRLLKQFSFIGERDSQYLDWRFIQSPYDKYHVFTLEAKDGKGLLGYMIFRKTEKRAQIVDLGFRAEEKWLGMLLSSFSRYQRSQGAESIALSVAGHPNLINTFIKNGYSIRSKRNKIPIYTPLNMEEIISRIKGGNWYLTSADNDI